MPLSHPASSPSSTSFRILYLSLSPILSLSFSPPPSSFPPFPLFARCDLRYFIRFFFFDPHRQTFEPQHDYSARSYGVRTEGTRTVELLAPYVPCRRRRYSLSYPYRTSSLRALRADIELRDRELEPARVDFRFPIEGNDPGSIGIRLPSFGAPYVRGSYVLDYFWKRPTFK